MAGSLVKITETTVSSAVASVTLGGSDWNNSYDVYMVKFLNVAPDTDSRALRFRITKSGSADTTANYDYATKLLRTDTTFSNLTGVNYSYYEIEGGAGVNAGELLNGVYYLFNFNNASEYSFVTVENTGRNKNGLHTGQQGGFVHTVASASDGVHFYFTSSANVNSGTFALYGLKK